MHDAQIVLLVVLVTIVHFKESSMRIDCPAISVRQCRWSICLCYCMGMHEEEDHKWTELLTGQFLQRAWSGRKRNSPGVSDLASVALTYGRAHVSVLKPSPVRL